MKIFVMAKLNKTKTGVENIGDNTYNVWTKMSAKENKANFNITNQLAKYFDVPKSSVILKSGVSSKKKVFIISE